MNKNSVKASFLVSKLIAEKSKPFVEGKFIKDCLMTIVETFCPVNAYLKIQSSKQLKPNIYSIISNKQLRVSNNTNK